MAKTDRLQVRIDPEVKARANALFENLGLTTSDAVTLFIQHALNKGGLPFNVKNSCNKRKFVNSSRVK